MKEYIQDDLNKIIGDRIYILRENAHMKRTELARVLNIHRSTMTRIEAGERILTTSQLLNLSEYFNVSIFYLLGLTDCRKNNSEYIDDISSTEDMKFQLLLRLLEDCAKNISQNKLSNYDSDKQKLFATRIYRALDPIKR